MTQTPATIDLKKLSACIHCGLCLEACPTYRLTGEEMSSPRGRLYLMRNYSEGMIEASDEGFIKHEYSCLVCRACETACPSGVQFGSLMEQTRSIISQNKSGFRRFVYTKLLRSKKLLRFLQIALALGSQLGIFGFAKNVFRSGRLGASLALLPRVVRFSKRRAHLYRSKHPNGKRVGLLPGCVGDVFTSHVNDATIKALTALGYDVDTMPHVACCGALAVHAGFLDEATEMAQQNLKSFGDRKINYVIANIAGCGAMLKEYDSLVTGADDVRNKIFDINEFLYRYHYDDLRDMLRSNSFSGKRIAYQAPCHLLHGQRIVNEPVELLRLLSGAVVFPLDENDLCCGSAGSYNIEHPEMAETLRLRKMAIIQNAKPDIVVTANAGCMLQLNKNNLSPVRHVIELLAEALS